jgi:hypothetical protein
MSTATTSAAIAVCATRSRSVVLLSDILRADEGENAARLELLASRSVRVDRAGRGLVLRAIQGAVPLHFVDRIA